MLCSDSSVELEKSFKNLGSGYHPGLKSGNCPTMTISG